MEQNENNYLTIDLMHVLRSLWRRAWIIVLAGILAGAVGLSYAKLLLAPQYASSVLLYVNNSSFNLGSTSLSISSGDITASQSLVKTYTEILKNRTTLERIAEKAKVNYNYKELHGMISAGSLNGTQIMRVEVTCDDPYVASNIANCIAEVLPERISEIIDGTSMAVVDSAIPNLSKVSPSITKYTALGVVAGVFAACLVIAVMAVLDDTIHDEDYIIQNYDYPILAKIPNLSATHGKEYGYRKYKAYRSDSGTSR